MPANYTAYLTQLDPGFDPHQPDILLTREHFGTSCDTCPVLREGGNLPAFLRQFTRGDCATVLCGSMQRIGGMGRGCYRRNGRYCDVAYATATIAGEAKRIILMDPDIVQWHHDYHHP